MGEESTLFKSVMGQLSEKRLVRRPRSQMMGDEGRYVIRGLGFEGAWNGEARMGHRKMVVVTWVSRAQFGCCR